MRSEYDLSLLKVKMGRTVLKPCWYSIKPTLKQINKKKYKQQIFKASKKLDFTKHWEERLKKRFTKSEEKIRINIINSIKCWWCTWNEKYQTYKVYWNFGIYILSVDYKIITVMNENTGSHLDKYNLKVPLHIRNRMLRDLWMRTN